MFGNLSRNVHFSSWMNLWASRPHSVEKWFQGCPSLLTYISVLIILLAQTRRSLTATVSPAARHNLSIQVLLRLKCVSKDLHLTWQATLYHRDPCSVSYFTVDMNSRSRTDTPIYLVLAFTYSAITLLFILHLPQDQELLSYTQSLHRNVCSDKYEQFLHPRNKNLQ